jgi:hypothetical protein
MGVILIEWNTLRDLDWNRPNIDINSWGTEGTHHILVKGGYDCKQPIYQAVSKTSLTLSEVITA